MALFENDRASFVLVLSPQDGARARNRQTRFWGYVKRGRRGQSAAFSPWKLTNHHGRLITIASTASLSTKGMGQALFAKTSFVRPTGRLSFAARQQCTQSVLFAGEAILNLEARMRFASIVNMATAVALVLDRSREQHVPLGPDAKCLGLAHRATSRQPTPKCVIPSSAKDNKHREHSRNSPRIGLIENRGRCKGDGNKC